MSETPLLPYSFILIPNEAGTIFIPVLLMGKLEFRELKWLAQDNKLESARDEIQSQVYLTLEPMVFPLHHAIFLG